MTPQGNRITSKHESVLSTITFLVNEDSLTMSCKEKSLPDIEIQQPKSADGAVMCR